MDPYRLRVTAPKLPPGTGDPRKKIPFPTRHLSPFERKFTLRLHVWGCTVEINLRSEVPGASHLLLPFLVLPSFLITVHFVACSQKEFAPLKCSGKGKGAIGSLP